MQSEHTRLGPDALTVRFVRQAPDDEVLYFVRRCARERAVSGPLTIVLEPVHATGHAVHEVRLEQHGRILVSERDPEVLLAVRNAFDRFAPMESAARFQSAS